MAASFPPQPVYPHAIDSDRTLFLVYNTAEARLAADNSAWSEEIEIIPVGADESEIWADNGFATIEGELFYYDAVEKDSNGKVYKFKRCARNLGGQSTKFNKASSLPSEGGCPPNTEKGTWVRGFVIAEHHNQLVDAIIATEQLLDVTNDSLVRLEDEAVCIDDVFCPEVDFDLIVVDPTSEQDECREVEVAYNITITGTYNSFSLDFGDGTVEQGSLVGTHTYPPNTTIDPIVTVSSDFCQVTQTPITRTEADEPVAPEILEDFLLPIPPPPDFPEIVIPDVDTDVNLEIPQFVFPDIGFGISGISFNINVPSIISLVPPIPTIITLEPTLPSIILIEPPIPSIITIVPNIPSIIEITGPDPPIPTEIQITGPDPPIPSEIQITGPDPAIPSDIQIVGGPDPSVIQIVGGPDPSVISIVDNLHDLEAMKTGIISVTDVGGFAGMSAFYEGRISVTDYGDFANMVAFKTGIISVTGDDISVDVDVNVSATISVVVEHDIPSTISLVGCDIPSTISIVGCDIPSVISVEWGEPPCLSVCWGDVPTITCSCEITVNVECSNGGTSMFGYSPLAAQAAKRLGFDEDFLAEPFESEPTVEINPNSLGIPSEIKIIAPVFPEIRIKHDIPETLKLDVPKIPNIQVELKDIIPTDIQIIGQDTIPRTIELNASNVPEAIKLDASEIPAALILEPASDFPEKIQLDASGLPKEIPVTGIPDSIEVKIPSEITARLEVPENIEVPLVYKGGPVPIEFGKSTLAGDGEAPCFQLIPCNPK